MLVSPFDYINITIFNYIYSYIHMDIKVDILLVNIKKSRGRIYVSY